ncbi:thiamine pyrophosphate-dependent enzyme [Streptomyces sp. AS58]|uniref:Phosphonopyruvate decarboxylase beta subunit n=1 Tax=Streptomyces sp. MMG1662 TaxID=1415548 RepID=U5YMU1_9ACTN|nr:thiamine pyrophosphate-dependent enzyme [Streptomyces sp. AS58]AGZ93980.1 phosphonopyruvate decarboxylase beta subunit [Streptomyces sp. MMG1662]
MRKSQAIGLVLGAAGDAPVVTTTRYASRIAAAMGDRPQNFYMTGSMGLAGAVGVGLAATLGRRVYVIDGDGSVLMNASVLATIGGAPSTPLTQIVLDDGVYASTGGQPTHSASCDFAAMALACGYPRACTVSDADGLARALAPTGERGPHLIRCRLETAAEPPGPRIPCDLPALAATFRVAVSKLQEGTL